MDFTDVLKKRESIRHFSNKHLDDELIETIIDEAKWAPSPGNSQPWLLDVLSAEKTKEMINKFEIKGWEHVFPTLKTAIHQNDLTEDKEHVDPNKLALDLFNKHIKIQGTCRAILLYRKKRVLHDYFSLFHAAFSMFLFRLKSLATFREKAYYIFKYLINIPRGISVDLSTLDASLTCYAYSLILCAHNKGISSCLQWTYNNVDRELRSYFNLDSHMKFHCVIFLGYKQDEPIVLNTRSRKDIEINWIK